MNLKKPNLIRKITYQPFFMTLEAVMVKGFDCNSKSCARFHWSSSIFFNPSFEHTTKPTFTKKTLRSKISCCQLKIIEREFPQPGSNFNLIFNFWCRWVAFSITSGGGCWRDYWNRWLVSTCIKSGFAFSYLEDNPASK